MTTPLSQLHAELQFVYDESPHNQPLFRIADCRFAYAGEVPTNARMNYWRVESVSGAVIKWSGCKGMGYMDNDGKITNHSYGYTAVHGEGALGLVLAFPMPRKGFPPIALDKPILRLTDGRVVVNKHEVLSIHTNYYGMIVGTTAVLSLQGVAYKGEREYSGHARVVAKVEAVYGG